MAGDINVLWLLEAHDRVSGKLRKIQEELKKTTGVGEEHGAGMSGALKGVAMSAAALATTVVGVGAITADMASKYQEATTQMQVNAGITDGAAKAIGATFLQTAGKATFSAQEIMSAYAPVAGQLGLTEGHALSASEAMQVMKASMDLAEATGKDLGSTTSSVAKVMQAFQLPVSAAANTVDVLFNVSRATNQSTETLAASFGRLHTRLGPLAPSLSDMSSLMLDLNAHGVQGARGLMMVTGGLNMLLSGAKPTQQAVAELGLHLYTANGHFVGMRSIIEQLSPKLQHMTEQQRLSAEKMLFGSGASKALDTTLLAGVAAYDKASAAANKHGTAQDAATTKAQTMDGMMKTIKSTLSDIGVTIGQAVLPYAMRFAQWFEQDALPVLAEFAGFLVNQVVPAIAGLADFIGTKVIPTLEQLGKWVVQHVTPIFQAFAAFIQEHVVPQIKQLADWFTKNLLPSLMQLWTAFQTYILPVLKVVGEVLLVLFGIFTAYIMPILLQITEFLIGSFVKTLTFVIDLIGGLGTGLASMFKGMWDIISGTLGDVVKGLGAVKDTIGSWIGDVTGFFETLPMNLMGIGYHIMNALKYPFQAAYHFIADLWNNSIGSLSFSIPGWVPGIGGDGFSMPKMPDPGMPSLDVGGRIISTGIALVHKGESVVPAETMPLSSGGAPSIHLSLDIHDNTFSDARTLDDFIDKISRRITGTMLPASTVLRG